MIKSKVNQIHEARETTDDGELLRRAASGDEAAFRHLYETHRTGLFRFSYRLSGSIEVAEDIVQECFLNLIRQPQGFDSTRGNLKMYLYGIARHAAFKTMRRTGIEIGLDDMDDEATFPAITTHATPLVTLIDEELASVVRCAVEELPALQREAIILFEFEELSLAEIAVISNATIGTVKARLHRARHALRTHLADYRAEVANEREAAHTEMMSVEH
ncbi:MAG: RNA polymerase sigma factor [Pyrinomonadaceae bacterium MAG19_C2-C3]|nr:RNA polymerase sigma factor [Pyrinomonadaceae bacterium MAG19_C2-C3]